MTDLDRDNLQRVVDQATPKQLASMVRIYWLVRTRYAMGDIPTSDEALQCETPKTLSYQQWLNHARPQWDGRDNGTVYIAYYNMVMGIESDGHRHT